MPSFAAPQWLIAAPVLLYLLWRFQRNSFAPAPPRRRRFWLALRAVIVLMIVAALAGLQLRIEIAQKQILFLVDLSDSIPPEQRERSILFVNKAMARIQPPDQAGIIVFGTAAEVERFPTLAYPLSRFESQVDGASTNLEEALELAESVFAGNYQQNIVVLSDGLENAGRAESQLQRFRQNGISVQSFYLQPSSAVEAALENVRLPDQIRLKEAFHLEAIMSSNHRMPALLQVFRNGVLQQEGTVLLESTRKELVRIPQRILEPGLYRYEIRLQPQQDFRSENNSQERWVSVAGPPRLLLLDEEPNALGRLAEALRDHGFQVDVKPEQYFPLTLQDMMLYQAIFMRNIPASKIHSQMPLIKQYVHDLGAGFAMLGGKKSFGPGGYYQTPVENVLPVQMDLTNKKYLADVAMVIVIDKSGSMSYADRGRQKIDLADEGGARVATLLKKSDQLGVLAVDSVPKWVFSLQRLIDVRQAVDSITSIRAGGGGIYVYSGLREAYQKLRDAKATVKHVILFADTADCEEKEGPSGESSLVLAQAALKEDQITTTTIGIGQTGDSDVGFLQQLATIGAGRFYFTSDMYTLPEIFTQESSIVQRYYITEETFTPKMVELEPILEGIQAVPDLQGYVATSAKAAAGVGLISHREDPVLAFWRYGLGHSIAFTSDPTSEWGKLWLEWPDFQRFWAQVARYLSHTNAPANFRTSFSSSGERTTIVVEAFDENGELLESADYSGVLLDRTGEPHTLAFTQTAPGRYEAAVSSSGNLFGKIVRLNNGEVAEESIVQFHASNSREMETSPHGREHLLRLTGRSVETPEQLRFTTKHATDIQPLGDRLLFWAALLFLIDVAARKIELRRLHLFQRQQPVAQPVLEVTSLQQLKKRKMWIEQTTKQEPEILVEVPQVVLQEPEKTETPSPVETSSEYMERLKRAKKRRHQGEDTQ